MYICLKFCHQDLGLGTDWIRIQQHPAAEIQQKHDQDQDSVNPGPKH